MGSGTLLHKGLAMTPEEFWSILHSMPEPAKTLFRLYYDEQGRPIEYSHDDKPGNYINVDPETFRDQSPWVRVVNNQLIRITPPVQVKKLTPGIGTACHPQDICVVVDPATPHTKWSLRTNETN